MLIYNAEIYTMCDEIIDNGYVEIHDGKITDVCSGQPKNISAHDINADGGMLLPGFIDAHTHLGIIENGIDFEGDDCNEATDPFTPNLRPLDAINPMDLCFKEARERGVTSAVIAPGSANACGGEIIAVKTMGRRADDILIKTVGMKFALGENPKRVYNDRDETPVTRMATAALIREGLFKAKRYLEDKTAFENDRENLDPPEYDAKSEALIPLLKKQIKAHFHCHRADDMFTALRICKEFDIEPVLIHATEGHLIADILGEENAQVVTGPILCDRCKPEMANLDLKNAGEMVKQGVKTAVCTDHPETPIQYLPLTAAAAVKGGLSFYDGLRAITINAAEIVGVSHCIGAVKQGLDADLQIYHSNPLELLSQPDMVMINGQII